MRPKFCPHTTLLIALAAAVLLAAGCQKSAETPPPTVHPAGGKLLNRAGQPVAGGIIEFVKQGSEPRSLRAEVGLDGSFSLSVMTPEGVKYEGAEEGAYRVIYSPATDDQTVPPVELPASVKIQAGPNTLNLRLPK